MSVGSEADLDHAHLKRRSPTPARLRAVAAPSVHAWVPPSRRTEAERRHEIRHFVDTRGNNCAGLPLEITARTAKPVLRAPSGSRLPVPPLFASSAALRILPLGRGRLRGRRRHRRFPDPPKRHPCSRALQALWCEPDHACAPGCAARTPAGLQAGHFRTQAGPPPPRDLRDPVKHPGRVQARLEGMRGQLLPSPLLPHHCALSPPPALARAPWALGRQKFRFHCGVATACGPKWRSVASPSFKDLLITFDLSA